MKPHLPSALFVLFAVPAAASIIATPACATHDCDATTIAVGTADAGGTGSWITDCQNAASGCLLTWYSSDTMNSGWTNFPGNATLVFTFPPLPLLPAGLTPDFARLRFSAAVAATAPTADASDNFNVTSAAGQLDEFTQWSSTSISVMNASCSQYDLQLIVMVPALPTASIAAPDGETDADASNSDATVAATTDAAALDGGAQADSSIGE